MKTVPLKDGMWRVFLDTDEYRILLESAYDNAQSRPRREIRLEIRLMACSLRVDVCSGLTYGQFEKRTTSEGDYWVVTIQGKDSTHREAETRPRAVFIPDDIMEMVHAHAERKDLNDDDKLFQHSKRTVQRDVKRSAEIAAERTGNDDFKKISAHDLRRYFATHLLFRHNAPPPVVRVLGGWKSDDAMFEYLVLPDDVLFEELADVGLLGTPYDKMDRNDDAEKISATTTRLAELLQSADDKLVNQTATEIKSVFEAISEINMEVDAESEPDDSDTEATSLPMFADDDRFNAIGPVAAIASGYWNSVGRVVDWVAARGNSLWNQHVNFNVRQWLQEGTVRRVCAFSLFLLLAVGILALQMARMGVYIDPSTWSVAASREGVLALITAAAVYVGMSGNMWEEALADLTEQERLAELLTINLGNSE